MWQKSIQLVKDIYLLTSKFPKSEKFGLVDQIRRASVSIPSNIAEGHGRNSSNERRQFVSLARGSASEVETQLILAKELKFISEEEFAEVANSVVEILKMLAGLQRYLA